MKFNFKQILKVTAFYLEKQKSFIPKKKYFFGRTAKIHPKGGVCRLNFPEGFEKYDEDFFSNFVAFSENPNFKGPNIKYYELTRLILCSLLVAFI